VVAIEISDEAVRPDPDVTGRFRCVEHLGGGVEKLLVDAAVRQSDVDGDPWCEWTVRADIRLGVENHDDSSTIVEMGIEVPPFIAAAFRTDALTVFELRYFDGSDARFLVIVGTIRQPKMAVLAAMHEYLVWMKRRRLPLPFNTRSGHPATPLNRGLAGLN
jgi:hypothetical protein